MLYSARKSSLISTFLGQGQQYEFGAYAGELQLSKPRLHDVWAALNESLWADQKEPIPGNQRKKFKGVVVEILDVRSNFNGHFWTQWGRLPP